MLRMKTPKDADMAQVLSFADYQRKKESFAASNQESTERANEGDAIIERATLSP